MGIIWGVIVTCFTMPKSRREKRIKKKDTYLDGRARKPHQHTPVLKRAFDESKSPLNAACSKQVCSQCKPVLSMYADIFMSLVHQGSDLKRKRAINPHPVKTDVTHYRDLVRQNEWLRAKYV